VENTDARPGRTIFLTGCRGARWTPSRQAILCCVAARLSLKMLAVDYANFPPLCTVDAPFARINSAAIPFLLQLLCLPTQQCSVHRRSALVAGFALSQGAVLTGLVHVNSSLRKCAISMQLFS
jgi:hypothetical protein